MIASHAGCVVSARAPDDHCTPKLRDSSLGGDVGERALDALEVVVELAERGVALEAEQAADVPGLVVVVDVQRLRPASAAARRPRTRPPCSRELAVVLARA